MVTERQLELMTGTSGGALQRADGETHLTIADPVPAACACELQVVPYEFHDRHSGVRVGVLRVRRRDEGGQPGGVEDLNNRSGPGVA